MEKVGKERLGFIFDEVFLYPILGMSKQKILMKVRTLVGFDAVKSKNPSQFDDNYKISNL